MPLRMRHAEDAHWNGKRRRADIGVRVVRRPMGKRPYKRIAAQVGPQRPRPLDQIANASGGLPTVKEGEKMRYEMKSIEHQLAEVIGRAKADGRDEVVDAAALILKFLGERKDKLAEISRQQMRDYLSERRLGRQEAPTDPT